MAITGSPSVFIIEQDLTNYDTITSVTNAAMVGDFEWGPINKITPINSTAKLVETFGYPNDDNYKDWFTAYNFLQYSGNLYAVRVRDKTGTYALTTEGGTGTVPSGLKDFEKSSNAVLFPDELEQTGGTGLPENCAWISNVVIENGDYFDGMDIADFTKAYAMGTIPTSEGVATGTTVTYKTTIKPFAVARYAGKNGNNLSMYMLDYEHCYNNFSYLVSNKKANPTQESCYEISRYAGASGSGEVTEELLYNTETPAVATAKQWTKTYTQYRVEYYCLNDTETDTYTLYKGSRPYFASDVKVTGTSDSQPTDFKTYDDFTEDEWTVDNDLITSAEVLENDGSGVYSVIGSQKLKEDEVGIAIYYNDKLYESGVFSLSENSTDSNGFDNNLYNSFNKSSTAVYFIKPNYAAHKKYFTNTELFFYGGQSGSTDSTNNVTGWQEAIDLFDGGETEYTSISLYMQGGASATIGNYYISLCNKKKDAIVCLSPQQTEVVNRTSAEATKILTKDSKNIGISVTNSIQMFAESSYAFMDGNYKYQYDSYNSCYRWVPLNGDIAGLFAQIDTDENPWMSIGNHAIKNCVKLAFYPNKDQRDELFYANINPVINIPSKGNVVYGDWTFMNNTVFNFVGVRRCFLYMENYIKQIAHNILFKQNDEITNTEFVQSVDPFLAGIVGGRGISEYKIYSGSTITSQEDMDKGIFRAKILIKPIRSIRYVELTFSAVRSDVNIEEVI